MTTTSPVIRRRGVMLVVSSPSGAGKTTLTRTLLERDPDVSLSVSVTTRPPRPGEVDGVHYHFIDKDQFGSMVERGELLEHAHVYGYSYGTPRPAVELALAAGKDVLFDIDWQGAQQLRLAAEQDLVGIFILPPTMAELERRLRSRAQDPEEVVRHRLAQVANDVTHWAEYDYVIVNHDLETSMRALTGILIAERLKRRRNLGLAEFVEQFRRSGTGLA
ncbi:guanylate kinase [Geminicoccus harenae]|uniref:guanylate kinase n=1 Tax=Geminicoccus harenae TaxID=2498453 RepID=UPI00168BF0FE|nr:guanylate kinase [Geminicoccus harenae]